MFKAYRFNPLLLLVLFTLAPLQGMETDSLDYISTEENSEETNSNYNHVEIETYAPNGNTFRELSQAIHARNLNEVERILKTYPAIINRVDAESLKIPYCFFAEYRTAETHTYALQITHLLLSFGMRIDQVNSNKPYQQDPNSLLKALPDELERRNESERNKVSCDEIIDIIERHIITRLYVAIQKGDVDEVRRLVQKYTIDINTESPCYNTFGYGTPSVSVFLKNINPTSTFGFPLHYAAMYNQSAVVRLLVDELGAKVNIQCRYNATALHQETHLEIAQFLISKGANLNLRNSDGQTPIDCIDEYLTPEMLNEIGHQTERVENFRALKATFEGRPYIPGNNANNIQNNDNPAVIKNDTLPYPDDNPTDNPTVITNGALPWKLIGGGVAVMIVGIAAKKLYNWWYTPSEAQEEENKSEAQDEQQPVADVHA